MPATRSHTATFGIIIFVFSAQNLPPYVSSDEDVAAICARVLAAVAAVTTR